jgi:hypothetical protein
MLHSKQELLSSRPSVRTACGVYLRFRQDVGATDGAREVLRNGMFNSAPACPEVESVTGESRSEDP